jgi:hypothetical protein
MTEARFRWLEPTLIKEGFPPADPLTGMYDLKKIDNWMDRRR